MKNPDSNYPRLLAIAPSTRGFGYAVLEGPETLVDWGVKSVKAGDKNKQTLVKVKELIGHYQPEVLVLENTTVKDSRRSARIKVLNKKIATTASGQKIKVVLISRGQMKKALFADGQGTKHEVAEMLALRFPQELGGRLPLKRRPWESEDSRMDIFAAVALGLVRRLREAKDEIQRHLKQNH